MTFARFGVIDTSLTSKSNGLGVGAMTLLKAACTHLTLSAGKLSCLATAKATADSKPLPLLGLLSTNHGSYAGVSVATVSTPLLWVFRFSGAQASAATLAVFVPAALWPAGVEPPPPGPPSLLAAQP